MAAGAIGKYERLDVLGHGTSGVVYLAWDTLLRREVALKEIRAAGPEREKVLEEARVLDRLGRHPHIVEVHSVDVREGAVLIDMELIRGGNLADLLRLQGGEPLPVREAVRITLAILDALAFAHEKRIIHRDVKPANILINGGQPDGWVKLTDFGLAEALGTGSVAGGGGTYPYMAPEDFAEDAATDYRSDLWAVGVVLYEMLSGRRPFQIPAGRRSDPFAWRRAIAEETPPPLSVLRPDLPPALDGLVRRSLSRDKAARYPTARAFSEALEAILPLLPVAVKNEEPADKPLPEGPVESVKRNAQNEDRPAFVFAHGAFAAYSLDDLLVGAAKHWDEARRALFAGSFEPFLREIGEIYIADLAAELRTRRSGSEDQRLREFLARSRAPEEAAGAGISPPHEDDGQTVPAGFLRPAPVQSPTSAFANRASPLPVEPVLITAETLPAGVEPAPLSASASQTAPRWWFWPVFLICFAPLVTALGSASHLPASRLGRFDDVWEAWSLCGVLAAMLLVAGIGARFPLGARLICAVPVACGLIAAGALVSQALNAPHGGGGPDTVLRVAALVLLPLALLLIEAATTHALWRVWGWVVLAGALAGALHYAR